MVGAKGSYANQFRRIPARWRHFKKKPTKRQIELHSQIALPNEEKGILIAIGFIADKINRVYFKKDVRFSPPMFFG